MILPSDDSFELDAADDGGLALNQHNAPLMSLEDGKGLLPSWARGGTSTVRNAWLKTWGAMTNLAWARGCFTLDFAESPRFAEGKWLDVIWGVYFQKVRIQGEEDPVYRARLLVSQDIISPSAIKTIVDALVLNYTPLKAAYLEPAVDFIACSPADGSAPWASFVQPSNKRLLSYYPDRSSNPPSYLVPPNIAQFWIVLPTDSNDDSETPHCESVSQTSTSSEDFVYPDPATVIGAGVVFDPFVSPANNTLLEEIRSEVEQRRAGGITWFMFIDPLLGTAL